MFKKNPKITKAQSAMEYVMSYGWAILILAIAIAALFALGFFNGSNTSGNVCILNQGFQCISSVINTNGILFVTITQTSASYVNITSIGCSSDPNNKHLTALNTPSNQVYMPYGSGYTFSVQCYTQSGATSLQIGQVFYGSLYLNYTNDVNGFPGFSKGSITAKATTSGILNTGGGSPSGSGSESYLQIKLVNYQTTATQANFQQMIYFNPTAYSSNEMKNLSNIEFSAGAPIGTSGNVPLSYCA